MGHVHHLGLFDKEWSCVSKTKCITNRLNRLLTAYGDLIWWKATRCCKGNNLINISYANYYVATGLCHEKMETRITFRRSHCDFVWIVCLYVLSSLSGINNFNKCHICFIVHFDWYYQLVFSSWNTWNNSKSYEHI